MVKLLKPYVQKNGKSSISRQNKLVEDLRFQLTWNHAVQTFQWPKKLNHLKLDVLTKQLSKFQNNSGKNNFFFAFLEKTLLVSNSVIHWYDQKYRIFSISAKNVAMFSFEWRAAIQDWILWPIIFNALQSRHSVPLRSTRTSLNSLENKNKFVSYSS